MRYIGLMSGTSMDGIDAVLVDCPGSKGQPLSVRQHHHLTMPAALRQSLVALNSPGANELHRAALAANELARCCAAAVHETLHLAGAQTSDVCAIGAHGQTVRHRPGEFDATGYTLQLLNGALLAELCGIDVVCDFRSRDLAAGGQGAPLVPAFHAALWGQDGMAQAVLNLGGIGNLSLLGADGTVGGFDCGPGNALMDLWCERHLGQPYDHDGAWAAGGHVIKPLLSILLSEPFFERIPPKSTGRDLFNADWLDRQLAQAGRGAWEPQDVQAWAGRSIDRQPWFARPASGGCCVRLAGPCPLAASTGQSSRSHRGTGPTRPGRLVPGALIRLKSSIRNRRWWWHSGS